MTDQTNDRQYLATTALKAIDILNVIGKRSMSASEISASLGINKTTVHRLLYTLEYAGYIERMENSNLYRLGIKLVELCSVRINDIELKTEAKPFLMKLVGNIGQPVHLGIYDSGKAVFIDKIDVSSTIRMYSAIGRTIPVHCSAIGKALLLDRSDEEILAILERYGMESFTPYTIQSPETLLAQLHEAQKKGYTVDNGEHEENVFCLAVPIHDYRKTIIASISTAAHKVTVVDQARLIELLKATAENISARLGYAK